MSRHPYTHSCDFIRALAGYDASGTKLSRADASVILQGIAKVIGMEYEQLAIQLSEAQQAKTDADFANEAQSFIAARKVME
jgi:hypothetical protein